ncbi:LPP20 family lipoprotein [Hahella ganghwensis]|uniref:LPP20 family lipoprotein n=1 Tax=Hahella ganghwensis TaxID=286420 RepID=UPI00039E4274|nr:LPP20 family lipoprotein [Hahella ganghwensis]
MNSKNSLQAVRTSNLLPSGIKSCFNWLVLMVVAVLLGACNSVSSTGQQAAAQNYDPIVVRVSGYGTYEDPKHAKSQRMRLLAMRASKLDAYRALAERIYGTVIYGSSSVQALVLQHDEYKTMVDSVIRGARVISVSEMKGGGFETVLEVVLAPRFRQCLTNVNYFRYTEECRMPLPQGDPEIHASMESPSTTSGSMYYIGSQPGSEDGDKSDQK